MLSGIIPLVADVSGILLGIGGVVIGSLLTGGFTYLTQGRTERAAAKRQELELAEQRRARLHEQRVEAYSAFIDVSTRYADFIVNALLGEIRSALAFDSDEARSLAVEFNETRTRVELIGAGASMRELVLSVSTAMWYLRDESKAGTSPTEDAEEIHGRVENALNVVVDRLDRFVVMANRDLAS